MWPVAHWGCFNVRDSIHSQGLRAFAIRQRIRCIVPPFVLAINDFIQSFPMGQEKQCTSPKHECRDTVNKVDVFISVL